MNTKLNVKNIKFSFDKNTFLHLYIRHKSVFISLSIIVVCFFLFLFFILPQLQSFLSLSEQTRQLSLRNQKIQQNITFLQNLNKQDLSSKLTLAKGALPSEKDYAGIILAISSAASTASVSVDDFGFAVGDLSTPSGNVSSSPSIPIVLNIGGGFDGARRFLSALSKTTPLSEVTLVQQSGNASTITVFFYYKPFVKPPFVEDVLLKPFSQADIALFTSLASFSSPTVSQIIPSFSSLQEKISTPSSGTVPASSSAR